MLHGSVVASELTMVGRVKAGRPHAEAKGAYLNGAEDRAGGGAASERWQPLDRSRSRQHHVPGSTLPNAFPAPSRACKNQLQVFTLIRAVGRTRSGLFPRENTGRRVVRQGWLQDGRMTYHTCWLRTSIWSHQAKRRGRGRGSTEP